MFLTTPGAVLEGRWPDHFAEMAMSKSIHRSVYMFDTHPKQFFYHSTTLILNKPPMSTDVLPVLTPCTMFFTTPGAVLEGRWPGYFAEWLCQSRHFTASPGHRWPARVFPRVGKIRECVVDSLGWGSRPERLRDGGAPDR